jgi:hypothetical protein
MAFCVLATRSAIHEAASMLRWMARLTLALALALGLLSCAHQDEATDQSEGAPDTKRVRRLSRRPFDVDCAFGITGCESQASEYCGFTGFHVLGSYKTQGIFGSPYYHMRAACGPPPGGSPAASPPQPYSASPPAPPRREPAPPGEFEVECRFGISGCESEASEKCGYPGYHVLGSYRTQGAFGTPYFYMKAACGPAPGNNVQNEPARQDQPAPTSQPSRPTLNRGTDRNADPFEK